MKAFTKYGLTLGCLLLTGCQSFLPVQGANNPHTGKLVFRFQWPEFRAQALLPTTQYIVVAVYRGAFSEQAVYQVVPAGQQQLQMGALPVGETRVVAVAVDAQHQVLNGDLAVTTILPQQRQPVLLDLQADFLTPLHETERQALLAWLPTILPTLPRLATSGSDPIPGPTPSPSVSASPSAIATVSPQPQVSESPEASLPSPETTPTTGSRSSGDSGSSANPTPNLSETANAADLNTTVTLHDGEDRSDTVVIQ